MLARLLGFFARLLGGGRNRNDEPSVSLVILTTRVPELPDDEVVTAVKRALPVSAPEVLPGGVMPPPAYASDADGCRTLPVAVNRAVYGILIAPFPYTDPSEPLQQHDREDFMRAYQQHRGWMAIDFITGSSEDAYSVIGQIGAELMDDSACLLFVPALGLATLPSPTLVEDMRKGVWLQHFNTTGLDRIYQKPADDPALQEAAHIARSRWDEFVEAFTTSKGENFSAKFPFADGDQIEHMWIVVTAVEDSTIRGTLGNEPTVLTNISEGDAVERRLDELEDWLFMRNGALFGGFSLHVFLGEPEP